MKADLENHPKMEEYLKREKTELILKENSERWVLFPIEFPTIFTLYKKLENDFFTPEDFEFSTTSDDVAKLALDLKLLLGSSVKKSADDLPDIIEISCSYSNLIQISEGRAFMGFQATFENFGREILSTLSSNFIASKNEKEKMIKADVTGRPRGEQTRGEQARSEQAKGEQSIVNSNNSELKEAEKRIKQKRDLIRPIFQAIADKGKQENSLIPFCEILVYLSIFKSIFFSGLLLLSGQDAKCTEGMQRLFRNFVVHSDFSSLLLSSMENKLPFAATKNIVTNAIDIELQYLLNNFNCDEQEAKSFLFSMGQRILQSMNYNAEEHDINFNGQRSSKNIPPLSCDPNEPFYVPQKPATKNDQQFNITEDF